MAKKFKRELTQQEKDYFYLIKSKYPQNTDIEVALSILSEVLLAHERQFIHALAHAIGEEMTKRFVIHPDYSGLSDLVKGVDKVEN